MSHKTGKRVDLQEPPTDALRLLHPLSFAEPSSSSLPASDLDQKRQLGIVLAVISWLLRLVGRADLAEPLEAQLEYVPAPGGKMRSVTSLNGVTATLSPKPPPEKRNGSSNGKQRRSSRLASENGGKASLPDEEPPRSDSPAPGRLVRCMLPTCTNVLKGAEAIKKAVQGVGLGTEFAPVNLIASGHGRTICSILQANKPQRLFS